MAENFEDRDPDRPNPDPNPHPVPAPEGDLPADFFDDVTEPSPVSAPEAGPAPAPPPPLVPDAAPHFEDAPWPAAGPAPAPLDAPEPLSFEPSPTVPHAPTPADPAFARPAAEPPRAFPTLPVLAGLGLLALAGLGWYVTRDRVEPARTEAATPSTVYEPPESSTTGPTAASPPAGEMKEVRAQVDALAAQVKALQEKLDAAKAAPAADELKPVRDKLDELTKGFDELKPLPESVGKLDGRVGSVETGLSALKGQFASLAEEARKAATPPAAPASADAGATDRAIKLFAKGSYKEADAAFKAMEGSDPKDARYWDFAALARGAATGNWAGEPVRLVTRGVELEKAGTTPSAEVDAALDTLPATFNTFKTWLNAYRKPAR